VQGPRRRQGVRLGAEGAASIVFRKEIASAEDPAAKRDELVEAYRNTFATPFMAASRGLVDDIIDPGDTRRKVAMALELLASKRELRPAKKHGLGPV
jgi:methylmalonyl-CoA carboxyltransferase large subunit